MATRTSVGSGLWSDLGTWDTGVPADGDAVVIASGHEVTFNVDQSGFANGIGDLTVTGTLNVSTTVTSYMKIIAAKAIRGTGTFNIGTSSVPIPFAVKFTLTGGAAWYMKGDDGTGLSVNIYGTEPANPWVQISGVEAIGQTELSVGTDITGETNYWKAGDEVIAASYRGASAGTEFLTIASVAAGAITMSSGLVSAKATNDYIVLLSRNVTIIFSPTTSNISGFKYNKLRIGSARIVVAANYGLSGCNRPIISGGVLHPAVIGGVTACYSSSLQLTGGAIVGTYRGFYNTSYVTMSGGLIAGVDMPTVGCLGLTITGGIIYGYKDNLGAIGNGAHFAALLGGTIVGNSNGYIIYASEGVLFNGATIHNTPTLIDDGSRDPVIKNVTFTGTTGTVFWRPISATLYGVDFSKFTTLVNGYVGYIRPYQIVELFDHNGIPGDYKSWTRGGTATSQASVLPDGYSVAYLINPVSTVQDPTFMNQYFDVPAGESRSIEVQLRKSKSMVYLPRVYLSYSDGVPLQGETPLDSFTMTDSIDTWESDTFIVDNTSGTTTLNYKLVFTANDSSGDVYTAYKITDTTPSGGGGGAVSIQPISGRISL